MFWTKIFRKRGKETSLSKDFKKARSDRRRDPRIEEEKEIILEIINSRTLDEQEKKQLMAKSLDISVGGIRLASREEFSPNSLIKLKIPSDQLGKWIQVLARIKWIKKLETEKIVELGLEFIDLPPETVLDLMEHIYRRPS
ncbi:MAG: PilZ domain-containing protein [Candidatus Aminicenantes bacterium]|nr:PilZ domain-containing protein [Candidatus Aminicenantes bacterium]